MAEDILLVCFEILDGFSHMTWQKCMAQSLIDLATCYGAGSVSRLHLECETFHLIWTHVFLAGIWPSFDDRTIPLN